MDSLPNRPLLLAEIHHLKASSEKIADTTALTVLEIGGQAEIALSFVMSTYSPAYFGFVFDRDKDTWMTVFREFYEEEEDARDGFQNANDAIMTYFDEHTSMTQTDELTTPDDVTVDEFTITDPGADDIYAEYFE